MKRCGAGRRKVEFEDDEEDEVEEVEEDKEVE
jgi:hypothetical protein